MKNKENTKRKLLDAVDSIIRNEGFSGLGVNKVAKAARVSKILIYRYFGGFTELLSAYIIEQDFWKNCVATDPDQETDHLSVHEQVCKILSEQFNSFYNHCEMEAILVTEISNSNLILKNLVRQDSVNVPHACFNVVSTLLLAGTDHLIITEQEKDDVHQAELASVRKTDLLQSIGLIVEWTLR